MRGRYLPQSVLGKGGFGTAFLARDFDSPTQRLCVVKLFQPPVNLTPTQLSTALRLFGKEAEVLERLGLQHPQIPNLYAYFPLPVTNPLTNQSDELFYLVQEFVDGEDLEKILNQQGALSEAEVTQVLRAMLDVLGFVHRNGAIHRDVKPSNIIKGKDGRLSLLDFGAVKEVTAPSGVQRGPTTICSPDYAPPEQIMNGTVNVTSDLYALAATCVVLLTNKESSELRESSSNSWEWERYAQVSPKLAQVLNRMLRARPGDRYPSAEDVLAALEAVNPGAIPQPIPPPQPIPQPQPISQPQPPVTVPPAPPVQSRPDPPPISLPRFLGNAAFAGAQGGLLGIAFASLSLSSTLLIGGGGWLILFGILVVLQLRQVIEGMDLVIIAGVTLAAVVLFSPLHAAVEGSIATVIAIAVVSGGGAVAIAILFRLIFRLVSRIM